MACNCGPVGVGGKAFFTQAGLGQIDAGAVAGIFVHAKDLWDDLVAALGIGAGRREADIVVPVQNQVVATVITPVVDYLTRIRDGAIEPECAQLKAYQSEIVSAEIKWLNYLHTTKWQDGRAAQQAEATLAPYFAGAKTDLSNRIKDACNIAGTIGGTIGDIFTTPTGEINWPVVGIGAGLIFMLMRRK